MTYSKEDRKRLEKYHPECLRGQHVPVAAVDKHNRVVDVYCQNCLVPMTKEEHRNYFGNKTSTWFLKGINYDEPGDPTDMDSYGAT